MKSCLFDMEIWKPIPSIPDLEASSYGRIRRPPYSAPMPNGGYRIYEVRPTYGHWHKHEKRYCLVIYTPHRQTLRVAKLVCEAFHGESTLYCIHVDENSQNNRPENLKWATQKENLNGEKFLTYCRSRTGKNNPYVKGKLK